MSTGEVDIVGKLSSIGMLSLLSIWIDDFPLAAKEFLINDTNIKYVRNHIPRIKVSFFFKY